MGACMSKKLKPHQSWLTYPKIEKEKSHPQASPETKRKTNTLLCLSFTTSLKQNVHSSFSQSFFLTLTNISYENNSPIETGAKPRGIERGQLPPLTPLKLS